MIRNLYRRWVDCAMGRNPRRRWGRLRLELLEDRNLLAAGLAFQGPQHLSAGNETSAVTSADLNGDGLLDVIVADRQSTRVSVLLAVGDGTFANRLQFDGGRAASSVATGDVDGDGTSDLIIAGGEGQDAGFSVLRNNGVGSDGWLGLKNATSYAAGDRPTSIVVRDFDADGHLDIAVASSENVSVRLGNDDGTFADPIGYLPGAGSRWLAAGDLNADGYLDLAVSNGDSAQVAILLGSRDGTLESHDHVHTLGTPGQRGPWALTVDDWDGDGNLDLGVARDDSDDGNLSVLLGRGDGSFEPEPVKSTIAGSPTLIASGDIDEDGNLDLVVAHGGIFHHPDYGNASGGMTVLLGKGDGSFDWPIRLLTDEGKQTVVLADMDGDQRLDILSDGQPGALLMRGTRDTLFERELATFAAGAHASWATAGDFDVDGDVDLSVTNQDSGDVSLLLGTGDGQFTQAARHRVGVSPGAQIAMDLNADGLLDLAVVNRVSNSISILIGTGNGSFLQEVRHVTGTSPNSVVAEDLNGDAILDLVVASTDSNNLSVLIGHGDGTFASKPHVRAGEAPQSVIAHDLNADGHMDLVVANRWSGHVSVVQGNGDGTFGAKTQVPVGEDAVAVVSADLDGDGNLDLAVARGFAKTILVLPGHGDGTFNTGAKAEYAVADYPTSLTLADVNDDEILDVVSSNGEVDGFCRSTCLGGGISVLVGRADGTFEPAENYHFPTTDFRSVAAEDLDGDGDLDLVLANALGANVLLNDTRRQFKLQAGDANMDGRFDQSDIILVLRANKYKTGQPATWAEGDWNGDGQLDQLDIVASLQTGNYLQGPYVAMDVS